MAVFQDSAIVRVLEVDDTEASAQQILKEYQPQKVIFSSVIDHDPAFEAVLATAPFFHRLNHLSLLPISTPVGKPETIGADRLAIAAAAVHFHPQKNNLVIGLGTCITYNFINKDHEFLGGAISPGMEMRFKSLQYYTAKLPLIKPDSNTGLVGYDTRTNILTGVLMGMAHEIDGFIEQYGSKFSNFNVLLTGGDIAYLASHLKNKIFADPDLLFKGLFAISEVNNK